MHQVAVRDIVALLDTWRSQGLTPALLDVREPWEVATASLSLPGVQTCCIPMQQVPARHAGELDATQPLLVLCHHGMRSLQVTLYLSGQKYPHVYNIAGGIDAWSRAVDPSVPMY
jgi:rhodanese-related sulfurtransferase